MKLHLNNSEQLNLVHSCEIADNGFAIKIGETRYLQSLIVTSETVEMWSVNGVSDLNPDVFSLLAKYPAEVVILGTGQHITFPEVSVTAPLINKGIGLEVMDTAAACRTYNILVADGRKAIAALIA